MIHFFLHLLLLLFAQAWEFLYLRHLFQEYRLVFLGRLQEFEKLFILLLLYRENHCPLLGKGFDLILTCEIFLSRSIDANFVGSITAFFNYFSRINILLVVFNEDNLVRFEILSGKLLHKNLFLNLYSSKYWVISNL